MYYNDSRNDNRGHDIDLDYFDLIRAMAEHKSAKRTSATESRGFAIGFVALFFNTIAAIIALFIGCPCKSNEKNCFYWVMLAICCLLVFFATVLSIADKFLEAEKKKVSNEKEYEKEDSEEYNNPCLNRSDNLDEIDKEARLGIKGERDPDKIISLYINDTKKIEEKNKHSRRFQLISIALMAYSAILAIMTTSIFYIIK